MPNIIINNICNQRCSYCFAMDSMTVDKLPLQNQSLGTYLQILKFLKKEGEKEVRLLWGEPLLHPEISKFIKIANKGWFYTRIFSNINFSPEFLQKTLQGNSIPNATNCNINNRDFYSDSEYAQVKKNIIYLRESGCDVTIGYNVYSLEKPFSDIIDISRSTGIRRINLKVTNTALGSPLIVDTSSREFGKYLATAVIPYLGEFEFLFSCWLSKSIFSEEEITTMNQHWLLPKWWCDGNMGKYDIDVDGSIFKCFPTRPLYLKKSIHISNFSPRQKSIEKFAQLENSTDICIAHKL